MSELLQIIDKGEGDQLDFKHSIEDQKKIARTLVAFANTRGGSLLIGVKDNGKVRGVNPEEEYYMIEGAVSLYCKPEIKFKSNVWQEGHHLVLEIIVDKSPDKHESLDEDGKWSYYIRVEDHTLKANKILRRLWALEKKDIQKVPTKFDDKTLELLAIIEKRNKVTLSQLYKSSSLDMKEVDQLLTQLVYWTVVDMNMSENGTYYTISS